MVLKPSDYSLPEPGESLNPTSPVDFVSRWAGMVVALSAVAFAVQLARGKGSSILNNLFGSVTGGLVSTGGDDGPWGDV